MSQKNIYPSSICILRLSSIGDITHVIPVIKTIQQNLPKSDITWVIGKNEYQLVKSIKKIRFIIIDKNKTIQSILNLKNTIKGERFDVLLHMQRSLRSKLLSLFIRAHKKLNYTNVKMPKETHVLDSFFYFLKHIGIQEVLLDWSLDIGIPNKINVEFIKIINKKKIQMRVWERGVGETFACGSGACAAVFAGYKKNLINRNCEVLLKKGSLFINIINNKVIMTGPAEVSYYGNVSI